MRSWILCFLILLLGCVMRLPGQASGSQAASRDARPMAAASQAGSRQPAAVAEAAYRAGDYEKAKQSWTAMLAEHAGDGRLEYNLGNCEYRLGNPARALWRYERAQRVLGADERVRFNLNLAQRALGLERPARASLWAAVATSFRRLTVGEFFVVGLVLEVLGLLMLLLGMRKRARGIILTAVLLLLVGISSLVRAATMDPQRILGAIVLEDHSALRAEPRDELDAVLQLGAGVRAEYRAASPGWVKLRVKNREGWMRREQLGLY